MLQLSLNTYSPDGVDFVVVSLSVDGDALADFSYYATDLEELTRSLDTDGECFILTCWCGQPSCAGIYDAVKVRHTSGEAHWHVPQPPPIRDYVFAQATLRAALDALQKQIKSFVAERMYSNKTPYEVVPMQNERFFTLG